MKLNHASANCTQWPRAAEALRTNESHQPRAANLSSESTTDLNGLSESDGIPRAEPPRSTESHRAEQAYGLLQVTPPSERPLARARLDVASALDRIMHAHWVAGEESMLNTTLARRLGIDEKTVRQWREGGKPIPLGLLLKCPNQLFDELMRFIVGARGRTPRRGFVLLRDALDQVEQPVAASDRDDTLRGLFDAQARIAERIRKLTVEGR